MYDLGENTRDLRALGVPHPTEDRHGLPDSDREDRIHRRGTIHRWTGITLFALATAVTLILMTYGHRAGWDDPVTRQLIGLLVLIDIGIATALFTSGLVERQQRSTRTLIRRAMARADANADVGAANRQAIDDLSTRIDKLVGLVEGGVADVGKVQQELVVVQEKLASVPDYGQGLEQGARVAASVLGVDKD